MQLSAGGRFGGVSAAEMPIRRQKSARGQGDRLRRDLLEAAANLMATHGDIESVSLRAVAREAGVSATAVYRHVDGAGIPSGAFPRHAPAPYL